MKMELEQIFKKYPKIFRLGTEETKELFSSPEDEIIIEAKYDGANTRVFIKDNQLYFGSRNREFDDEEKEKAWYRCIQFIRNQLKNKNLKPLDGIILYVENMVQHTLVYDWERIPACLGFDIFDLRADKFLDYDEKIQMFEVLEIPIVPLVWRGKIKDCPKITDDLVPICKYAPLSKLNMKEEGLVIKNYSKGLMGKHVRDAFKEDNLKAFGMSKKFAKTDDEILMAMYVTNARIEKIIFKLLDDGHKLDMPLMHHLPKQVMEDIYEEHWKEIVWSNWSINFKNLRQKIPKRCIAVLKQMITNNSLK